MATTPTVPMYAPDGTLGDVPYDQMSSALRAGGKLGVNMKAPDGTAGVVPAEHVQEAAKAGGRIVPFNLSTAPADKKGIWDTFVDDVKSVFSGFNTADDGWKKGRTGAAVAERESAQQEAEARKAAGYSLPYRAAAPIAEALGTNVVGMEQAAKEGRGDVVIGHMLAGQALATLPSVIEGIGAVGGKAATGAAKALAEYKPQLVSELDKTHSLTGRLAQMGARKLLPDKPIYPGAPEPAASEFYSQSGAEQEAIRRRTVSADRAAAREQASQARTQARNQAKEGAPVPITESPNYDPGAYKAGVAERTSDTSSRIASPQSGAPKVSVSEGRPATWTNQRVVELAAKGDRNAITQAVRRGFLLPENARYVMGDMDYPSAVTSPKSVTKFSPTGEPIVQGESDLAYRSRDVGEQGVPSDVRSHAHATTDLEDLQRLAPGRESITGKPQEFVKADLSKLEEGKDFVRVHRPGQPDWIRFLRPLKEAELEKVPRQ